MLHGVVEDLHGVVEDLQGRWFSWQASPEPLHGRTHKIAILSFWEGGSLVQLAGQPRNSEDLKARLKTLNDSWGLLGILKDS